MAFAKSIVAVICIAADTHYFKSGSLKCCIGITKGTDFGAADRSFVFRVEEQYQAPLTALDRLTSPPSPVRAEKSGAGLPSASDAICRISTAAGRQTVKIGQVSVLSLSPKLSCSIPIDRRMLR